MRKSRSFVPIPTELAAEVDRIAGRKQRARFIIELLEREVRRRKQFDALCEAGGSWQDEEHPELVEGSDKWVREMRRKSVKRLLDINQQREAE